MSDSKPQSDPSASARKGNGSKYAAMLLIGLLIGVIGTVMALRAIDARKDHFHESVMHVQQWHLSRLDAAAEQNRCSTADISPHLQALRTMVDDIEPAFPDLRDDERFVKHATQLRAALNSSIASPPGSCEALNKTVASLGESCKACHQDFR